MNINIRKYIKDNFKNANPKEIEDSIDSSIEEKDEVTLPGLGVFFEILWENIDEKQHEDIVNILVNNL